MTNYKAEKLEACVHLVLVFYAYFGVMGLVMRYLPFWCRDHLPWLVLLYLQPSLIPKYRLLTLTLNLLHPLKITTCEYLLVRVYHKFSRCTTNIYSWILWECRVLLGNHDHTRKVPQILTHHKIRCYTGTGGHRWLFSFQLFVQNGIRK